MNKTILFVCFFAFANTVYATNFNSSETSSTTQDTSDVAEVPSAWELGSWLTLNGSQASFRNWTQGGVNNIAAASTARFTAEYKKDRIVYNNAINLKYGRARIEGGDLRKTDDEIRIRNQVRRLLDDPRFSMIFQVNFNTQFDKGYNAANTVIQSNFMAPGYLIETIGFAFNPEKSYQIDMGLSLKQTFVLDDAVYGEDRTIMYGVERGNEVLFEGGLSLGLKAERDIATNVNYVGQLETFTNFLKPVDSTTIRFTNEIIGKINSYLSANLQFAMVYDDSITKELQVKQVISIGFSYRVL
jgi:hypothetical protein